MAGQVFWLKFRDTNPPFAVFLKNPDGSPFNLTGATVMKLHVRKPDNSVMSRPMTVAGDPLSGELHYGWEAADWDTANGSGYLVAGPSLPLSSKDVEHKMEYEVNNGAGRQTFPNDGYDILRIRPDLGQA